MKWESQLQTALEGRYQVEREVGRGASAMVWLAQDLRHDRQVAVKVLHPDLSATVGSKRFLQEVRIAAGLQHPNILPVHDSGDANGLFYYVMPYVEGESLRDRLDREPQLPIDEAVRIAQEVADGLSHAHERGVVHRDIKPGNILLSGGHAIVADFGIATAMTAAGTDRLTATGFSIGTPAYMSPEQGSGDREIDGRSDQYSLACVLYEMLAGAPPYSGANAQAVVARHMYDRPPSLEIVRPSVPSGLSQAIERALAKVPVDRFDTALDFRVSIGSVAAARPPDPIKRTGWVLAAVLTLLVLLASAAWQALVSGRGPLDPNRIVVFPLAATDPGVDQAGVGWDVALAIGAALEHAQPLRVLDGWRWLPEEMRSDPRAITPEMELQISRDQGARYYLSGAIRGEMGDRAVVLRLQDALGDTLVAQETAGQYEIDVAEQQLGLQAVTRLLPNIIDPYRGVDLTAFTARRPGAIALSIQGDRSYRESRFDEALEFYRRAVAEDSLIAFAAAKGALSASWVNRYDEAADLAARAVRLDELLPRPYAHFVQGLDAFLTGDADASVTHFEAALELRPEWSEAHMAMGEVLFHLLPTTSGAAAVEWFQSSLELDPQFLPPLVHLAELAAVEGDLTMVRDAADRLRAAVPGNVWADRLELMAGCVEDGPGWSGSFGDRPSDVLIAATSLTARGSNLRCAEEGFRSVLGSAASSDGNRWGGLMGLHGVLMAEGRYDEALALLDSARVAGSTGVYSLYLIDALAVGEPFMEQASRTAELAARATGPGYEGASSTTLWLMGVWHVRHGELELANEVAATLATAVREGAGGANLARAAVEAHLDAARQDRLEAVRGFESLRPNQSPSSLTWSLTEHLALERLEHARLLLESGDYEAAAAIASLFDHAGPILFLPFLPQSLSIRLAAAKQLGTTAEVQRLQTRLTHLGWTDPPVLGGARQGLN